MIGLLSSVPEEGALISRMLGRALPPASGQLLRSSTPTYHNTCRGEIGEQDVIYTVSGMGKVNAAHAAAILIERFSPAAIILFGIGGAYPSSGLEIGDIAVAEKEFYGDEGVMTKEGFQTTDFIGIPLVKKGRRKFYNEFRLDRRLAGLARKGSGLSSTRTTRAPAVCSGTFLTVSTCTGTRKRAFELEKRFGAICENMEGAAVAQVCACYGVPFAEVRGISNIVEDRDLKKWNIPLAAENAQKAVVELLRKL